MALMIGDHQLKDFDEWFAVYIEYPPPAIGKWRLFRSTEDPSRAFVIGEVADAEVADVNAFCESERMQAVIEKVNAMSVRPIEVIWFDEVETG